MVPNLMRHSLLTVMLCMIWYRLYSLKNMKNTHVRVLLLIKLQPATLLNVTLCHGCFSCLLNCANGTIFRKASHMITDQSYTLPDDKKT